MTNPSSLDKRYIGIRAIGLGNKVIVRTPKGRYDLIPPQQHSPSGFEWGYGGSGPSDTALAILLDFFSEDKNEFNSRAQRLYQIFKWAFLADAPKSGFRITGEEIQAWYEEVIKKEDA